jgi:hypothetical protein
MKAVPSFPAFARFIVLGVLLLLCVCTQAQTDPLVQHDDAEREYAHAPAQGLPDTKVGKFTQALYDEAQRQGWTVISMKNDWKRIFAFEP